MLVYLKAKNSRKHYSPMTIQPAVPKGMLPFNAALVFLSNYGSHFLFDTPFLLTAANVKENCGLVKKEL